MAEYSEGGKVFLITSLADGNYDASEHGIKAIGLMAATSIPYGKTVYVPDGYLSTVILPKDDFPDGFIIYGDLIIDGEFFLMEV